MKKKLIAILGFVLIVTVAYSLPPASKVIESVTNSETGDSYFQCINPGGNCAT